MDEIPTTDYMKPGPEKDLAEAIGVAHARIKLAVMSTEYILANDYPSEIVTASLERILGDLQRAARVLEAKTIREQPGTNKKEGM